MLQIIIELIILIAACVVGLFIFRDMNSFFRLIHIQVIVWIVFYSISHMLTIYQEQQGLPKNNQWLMNIHIIIETTLLTMAAYSLFRNKWEKRMCIGGLIFFMLVFILQAVQYSPLVYLHYADVSECILVTVLYVRLLYSFSTQQPGEKWRTAGIILCIGILLYFACSVPYVAMMHYLQEKNPELNHFLFDLISNVLACIRYAAYTISFLLIRRKTFLKNPL